MTVVAKLACSFGKHFGAGDCPTGLTLARSGQEPQSFQDYIHSLPHDEKSHKCASAAHALAKLPHAARRTLTSAVDEAGLGFPQ